MEIENIHTFERSLREGINIFTGAGFSVLAKDKQGKMLPVGDDLRQELLEKFPSAPKSLALAQLCTFLKKTKNDELEQFIRSRFDVSWHDEKYKNLGSINAKYIFTTNVDNLLETVFKGNANKYLNDINLNGITKKDKSAIEYVHLHGSVTNSYAPLIFGDLDIASAFSNDSTNWNFFRSLMNQYPTLYWGYALKDAGTLQILSDAIDDNNKKNSWIIVHPKFSSNDEIEYYKSLDLKIIKADTETFLDYLGKFDLKCNEKSESLSNPFPEYSIPSNTEINHRAIQDFYQGATPSWSDIYSPNVAKLRHFDSIEEHTNSGKNVLITGGPATGKSTLLMQFAAFHKFNGIKIFHSNISLQKAEYIAAKLSDKPTLLFVDNLQSSIEALNFLSSKKNIQLIIAERDYAYLSASNANFLRKNIEIIDITSLDEKDAQTVVKNIPTDLKSQKIHELKDGDSLFELIERNCRTPTIKDRFKNVIGELSKKDDKLVQLFLLACYLHTCRSVTSMDILYSFFGRSCNDYAELYKLLEILSSSVSDYVGEFADENQDYFSIRSNLLADHITTIAPSNDMAKMLTSFHTNVPRTCILNFDAFKRRAYDARIYENAFTIIEEGEKIYDTIYRKHKSPFNLQQKALYLSRRGEHQRAFKVIDEAIAMGGRKNWSIKNSYAIIQFKANIERENCADVRKALDESMAELEQCHSSDVRKAFHAMSYADHSLKYWKKYRDAQAITYLEKSKSWLSEECDEDNRIGDIRRLLNRVNNTISSAR